MNQTISTLLNHRSDRSFTNEPVSEEALCSILEAARRAPTSNNAQHISVVVVRDPASRARIAEIAGGQPYIATAPVFLAALIDFYKSGLGVEAAGKKLAINETMEGLLIGATDVGIAVTSMMVAARSLGLGCVPIGGIRRNIQGLIDLLELPPHTFPLLGLAIGHIDRPAQQKPRLPMQVFRHDERYRKEGIKEAIAQYDATLMEYWKSTGRTDGKTWSENTYEAYHHAELRPVKPALLRQGLTQDR